ncbi:hypothetical protein [Antribacter gilvus]|nr:hypothetical protein [Antribacter gilvus]
MSVCTRRWSHAAARQEVLRKIGCRDRVQLVVAAYEAGLVRPERTRPS